ncbi:MAG: hypothetical protein QOH26_1519 [Actinomycetota bacterium]|jgi:hypothetical protein|nr:hypothetical protein [Actinomycetota bacterium]
MTTEDLDSLPSTELHHRAVRTAVKHLDARFLWQLVRSIPAAEAAAGHLGEAEEDVLSTARLLEDFINSDDDPEMADALRPIYLDYLKKHAK